MSYIDKNLLMSDAQVVTATASSTNSIDTLHALRDIGAGEPVELLVSVAETVLAAGAADVIFALRDSADNITFANVLATPAIGKATLVAGAEALRTRLPDGLRRYIEVHYTVGTGPLTAGKFNAALLIDRQSNLARPSGFTVA